MVTFLEPSRPCKRLLFFNDNWKTNDKIACIGRNELHALNWNEMWRRRRPASRSLCFLKFANHGTRVPQKRSDPPPFTTDPRLQPKFRFLPAVNNRPIAKYRIRNRRVVAKGSEAIVSDCRDEVFAILEMRSVQFLRWDWPRKMMMTQTFLVLEYLLNVESYVIFSSSDLSRTQAGHAISSARQMFRLGSAMLVLVQPDELSLFTIYTRSTHPSILSLFRCLRRPKYCWLCWNSSLEALKQWSVTLTWQSANNQQESADCRIFFGHVQRPYGWDPGVQQQAACGPPTWKRFGFPGRSVFWDMERFQSQTMKSARLLAVAPIEPDTDLIVVEGWKKLKDFYECLTT